MGCFLFRDLCIQPHGQLSDSQASQDPATERLSHDGKEAETPPAVEGRHGTEAEPGPGGRQSASAGTEPDTAEETLQAGMKHRR